MILEIPESKRQNITAGSTMNCYGVTQSIKNGLNVPNVKTMVTPLCGNHYNVGHIYQGFHYVFVQEVSGGFQPGIFSFSDERK